MSEPSSENDKQEEVVNMLREKLQKKQKNFLAMQDEKEQAYARHTKEVRGDTEHYALGFDLLA